MTRTSSNAAVPYTMMLRLHAAQATSHHRLPLKPPVRRLKPLRHLLPLPGRWLRVQVRVGALAIQYIDRLKTLSPEHMLHSVPKPPVSCWEYELKKCLLSLTTENAFSLSEDLQLLSACSTCAHPVPARPGLPEQLPGDAQASCGMHASPMPGQQHSWHKLPPPLPCPANFSLTVCSACLPNQSCVPTCRAQLTLHVA